MITDQDPFRSYPSKIAEIYNNWPKVTEKGSNISLTPIRKGKMLFDLYGDTLQDGTPTPDTPIPIESVTGNQVVSICGKNLFGGTMYNGIINRDGSLNANTTQRITNANQTLSNTFYLPKGTYTLSINNLDYCTVVIKDSNGNVIQEFADSWKSLPYTFTTTYDGYLYFSARKSNSSTIIPSDYSPQLEKGSTATEYENFNGNTYEVNLGKNLFNSFNTNTTKITTDTDGTMNISNVSTANGYCETGRKLKELCPNLKVGDVVYIYIDTDFYESGTLKKRIYASEVWSDGATKTITQTMLNSTVVMYGGYETTSHVKVMITKSLDSNYSPYFTPIELNKIGTYEDRIYKDSGKWYLEKNIGSTTFNGTETWTRGVSGNYYYFYKARPTDSTPALTCLSKYFTFNASYTNNDNSVYIGNSNIIFGRVLVNGSYIETASDFNTWLASNNVEVLYVLATPITTEITNTTLIEQLEALSSVKSKDGIMNISSNGDLPLIISASALKKGSE